MVGLLAVLSLLSGLTEAAILAAVAEAAAALVNRTTHVQVSIGSAHLTVTVGALIGSAAAFAVVRLVLQAPLTALPARLAADVQAQARERLFGAFTRASWAVQSRDREGHFQELMTSQVIQATQATIDAANLVTALLTFLVLVASAFALNVFAALVVLGASLLLFGLLRPLNAVGSQRADALSAAQMEYAAAVGEAIRVAEETQVFGVGSAQRERIKAFVTAARDLFFRTQFIGRVVPNLYQSLLFLIIIAGLAGLFATGAGHLASLGAVVLLLVRAGTYGQQVQAFYQSLRQALPFVDRLERAERRYASSSPVTGTRRLAGIQVVALDEVSYEYRHGRPALSDVSFEVRPGERIGIVGPSGAGKSTLVQILLRLRAPASGRYLVNGIPTEQFAPGDWHQQVAYVAQEPRLLHASVADNIRYFRDVDDDAVERAARLAGIHEDVMRWAQGYDTMVGPRADAVSGGEQQRICLARALAAEPSMLVLDEPTSALDPRSEALIKESLVTLGGGVTLFIVAHRMSTLDICDRVMVVVDGRLEAFDTTNLLHATNSYYRSASAVAVAATVGD
jgi:ATP-binding cassette, subfamily B, bacterial